jgi:hypothetical protein
MNVAININIKTNIDIITFVSFCFCTDYVWIQFDGYDLTFLDRRCVSKFFSYKQYFMYNV